MHIEARLDTPYSGKPYEAKGFKLRISDGEAYDSSYSTTVNLSMTDAVALVRALAGGIQEYRKSMNENFGKTVEQTVNELEELFK